MYFWICNYHPIVIKPLHMSVSNITRVPILIHTMDMIKIQNSSITILIKKRCFGLINMYKRNFYVIQTDSNDAKSLIPLSSSQYFNRCPLGWCKCWEWLRIIINCVWLLLLPLIWICFLASSKKINIYRMEISIEQCSIQADW